jgi:hypothetical protein
MIATHLHHDDAGLEVSVGRAFEKLVNFFLNLVTDLLLSTFLIYSAGDILDFNEVGLHCRSAQINRRAALWEPPWHRIQRNVDLDSLRSNVQKGPVRVCEQRLTEGEFSSILASQLGFLLI